MEENSLFYIYLHNGVIIAIFSCDKVYYNINTWRYTVSDHAFFYRSRTESFIVRLSKINVFLYSFEYANKIEEVYRIIFHSK